MPAKYFLDTNVFVYCFDATAPKKSARAKELVRNAHASGDGVVSYQVVQEFLNVALRRFSTPMAPMEAEQYVSTVFLPMLAVHSSAGLLIEALRLTQGFALSWYDALILAAAAEAQCTLLYSEDLQDGLKVGGLKVVNPFIRGG